MNELDVTLDDIQTLARVAAGDGASLARLYDRYGPLCLGVAERILGVRREAEDLVHDLFLEVWQNASRFDSARGTVRTWLLVRLRSRAIDRLRSSRLSRAVSLDHAPAAVAAAEATGDFAQDRGRVRDALASLPAEQREVLILGYFEGLSSSEIAVRVGVPIGTVKSRVAAARTRMRALLGAQVEH